MADARFGNYTPSGDWWKSKTIIRDAQVKLTPHPHLDGFELSIQTNHGSRESRKRLSIILTRLEYARLKKLVEEMES